MKYNIKENTIDNILNPYLNNFNYIYDQNMIFDVQTSTLTGHIQQKGSHYLKKISKIFNNTEVILASNQAGLIVLLSVIAIKENALMNENEEQFNQWLSANAELVLNGVMRSQVIHYKKMIPLDCDIFPFNAQLTQYRKTKNGIFFVINVIFGNENNFSVTSKGFLLNENVHFGNPYESQL